jgi:predicted nucleic acid-binding protein
MQQRQLCQLIFHIDTNLINARGKLDTMNQIEKWASDEVILVHMSGVSFNEAQAGENSHRTRKALTHIFTFTDETIDFDDLMYRRIETTLFPQGIKCENERNDVKIVYEAAHYQAILITHDGDSRKQPGGILGNRDKLKDIVEILRDTEAVELIREKIVERDNFNREVNRKLGLQLPEWTGRD